MNEDEGGCIVCGKTTEIVCYGCDESLCDACEDDGGYCPDCIEENELNDEDDE